MKIMPKKLDRPLIRRRKPNSEDEFIAVHSEVSGTEHILRKASIERWCQSTNHFPGTRLFFRAGETMVVIEDFQSISNCLLEKI